MTGLYIGVNGVPKKIKKIYVGVNGISKEIKKGYIGVNGIPKLFYQNNILPEDYQQVEYIRNSDVKAYFNIWVPKISNYTTFYLDFAITSIPYNNGVIGQSTLRDIRGNNTYSKFGIMLVDTNPYINIGVPSASYHSENGAWSGCYYTLIAQNINCPLNTRHQILFNSPGGYFYFDGDLVASSDSVYSSTGGGNQRFQIFYTSGPIYNLYHFSEWENESLFRDLYPCYRKSDNVIGLYDVVNKEFLTNAGSSTFYKGPNKS